MSADMASGVSILACWTLLYVIVGVHAQTYLRTGVVEPRRWDRSLLAEDEAQYSSEQANLSDQRWGVFQGKQLYLMHFPKGFRYEEKSALIAALRKSTAILGDYLPVDSHVLIADLRTEVSQLVKDVSLVRWAPHHKIAPEWDSVRDLIVGNYDQEETQSTDHLVVHQRVVSHPDVRELRLLTPTQQQEQTGRALKSQQLQLPSKLVIGVEFPYVAEAELKRLHCRDFQPAAAAKADWSSQLSELSRLNLEGRSSPEYAEYCTPEVHVSSSRTLTVSVCPKDLEDVLRWLSVQPTVNWLYPKSAIRFSNLNAGAITQGAVGGRPFDATKPETHPLWQRGIDGTGQLVGVGDSGVDVDSCYFFDPNTPFSMGAMAASGHQTFTSATHRKIYAYTALADPEMLDKVGHGTHVVGSIIGEKLAAGGAAGDRTDLATGTAPGAKVAFMDLSRAADGSDVNTPDDLYAGYFNISYQLGARIHSDSWGGAGSIYDMSSYYTDKMTYENPDFLPVMAAGNYGNSEKYSSTVTAPSTAKNCLTVGATLNYDPDYVSTPAVTVWVMTVVVKRAGREDQYLVRRLVQAGFGGPMADLAKTGVQTPLVVAEPANGCEAARTEAAGAVVLVRRGDCYFSNKLQVADAAGAVGVIVVSDTPGGYFRMDGKEGESTSKRVPMLGISKRLGSGLWTLLTRADSAVASFALPETGQLPAYEDIASFSSFGPTQDLRTKPDIVAPGEVLSALSDKGLSYSVDDCATTTKRGTSMATPVVAGSAALVRQYFTTGFYPSGAANPAHAMNPSGMLLKAVLMGGAVDMMGNTVEGLPLDPMGSRQGYGRVNLTNSLNLGNHTNLQVVDLAALDNGQNHSYCIYGLGGFLAITLVWYDPPIMPASDPTQTLLVNDLDLNVRAAGLNNALLRGNGQIDRINTVEKVTVGDLPPGAVTIDVLAANVQAAYAPQKYALVVQGAFTGVLASPNNPDPAVANSTTGNCGVIGALPAVPAGGYPTRADASKPGNPQGGTAQMGVYSVQAAARQQASDPSLARTTGQMDTAGAPGQEPIPAAADPEVVPAPAVAPEPAAVPESVAQTATPVVPEPVLTPEPTAPPPEPAPEPPPAPVTSVSVPPSASKNALVDALVASMTAAPGGRRLTEWLPKLPAMSISMPRLPQPAHLSAALSQLHQAGKSLGLAAAAHTTPPKGSGFNLRIDGLFPSLGLVLLGASVAAALAALFVVRGSRLPGRGGDTAGAEAEPFFSRPPSCYTRLSPGSSSLSEPKSRCPFKAPEDVSPAGSLSQLLSSASRLNRQNSSSSSALEKGLSASAASRDHLKLLRCVTASPQAGPSSPDWGTYPDPGQSRAHSDSELEVHKHCTRTLSPEQEQGCDLSFSYNLQLPASPQSLASTSPNSQQQQQGGGSPGATGLRAHAECSNSLPREAPLLCPTLPRSSRSFSAHGHASLGVGEEALVTPRVFRRAVTLGAVPQTPRDPQRLEQQQQQEEGCSVVLFVTPPDSPLSGQGPLGLPGAGSPGRLLEQHMLRGEPDCVWTRSADRTPRRSSSSDGKMGC